MVRAYGEPSVAEPTAVSAAQPRLQSVSGKMHVPELDGIRGFAALLVAFHHLVATSIQPEGWPWPVRWIRAVAVFGAYGVDIFFVLSGFLITSLLIQDRASPTYYENFYWKRALRILPLYLAILLAVYSFVPDSGPYVLISLLFVANFANVFHISSQGPFWTLAIEEQFYLIWPQMVRRVSVPALSRLSLGLCILIPALRVGAALASHHNFRLTPFRCDGLAMGALLACQWYAATATDRLIEAPRLWRRSGRWTAGAAILLTALSIAGLDMPRIAPVCEGLLLAGVSLGAYSLIAFSLTHPGSSIMGGFRSRSMMFFGGISYCFYLTHSYVQALYDHWMGEIRPGELIALGVRALVVVAVTIMVCLVARSVIERPAQSLRRYVLH